MPEHPVARYTEADLSRVIARDYPGRADEVTTILAAYGREPYQTDPLRVRMACLKLALGRTGELRRLVANACADYRDVLAWAEYPAYMRARTPAAQESAVETDWKQLQEWLHARQRVASP
jgi:hypothetical protein